MTNYREILRLSSLGLNKSQIAQSIGCSRTTVIQVLNIAEEKGVCYPLPPELTDGKLAELLNSLEDRAIETGFSLPEIESLQSRIEDALDMDFLDSELEAIEATFNVTIDFPIELKDEVGEWIRENSKQPLVEAMIEAARREE